MKSHSAPVSLLVFASAVVALWFVVAHGSHVPAHASSSAGQASVAATSKPEQVCLLDQILQAITPSLQFDVDPGMSGTPVEQKRAT